MGALLGISLILGLCFDYLIYGTIPGIGFSLYIALAVAGLFVLSVYLKKPVSRQVLWLLIPMALFSAMVFVRASILLTLLNVAASFLLLLLIARVSFGVSIRSFLIGDYFRILLLPAQFLLPLLRTLAGALALRSIGTDKRVAWQVFKGVLMAIPILFIFLLLFSSADLLFQKYLSDIIHFDIEPETVIRSALVLMAALAFTGAYSYVFLTARKPPTEPKSSSYTLGHIEASILLGSINALFFIFILVQLTYLFGGESTIVSAGFTYAEYARRGFFELIAVAVISFVLLWSTEKYIAKKDAQHSFIFKLFSSALIAQVVLIMGSAVKRLLLYEQAYGFTTLRLYSHAFVIFLGVIFCLLLYKIYVDKRESVLAFGMFASLLLFLAVMNALNPDAFIAARNLERFAATGKLDTRYVSRLSDDALPVTVALLDASQEEVCKSFAREMYNRTQSLREPSASEWQSLNLSRLRAAEILASEMDKLEQFKEY